MPQISGDQPVRPSLKPDTDPSAILSWHHWPQKWQSIDLTTYRHGALGGEEAHAWFTEALRKRNPLSLCNMSDADIALWAYRELLTLPEVQPIWLNRLIHTTGVTHDHDQFLWPLLDIAYQETSTWIIQNPWDIAARLSYCCMKLKGVEIRDQGFLYHGQLKKKVNCQSIYTFVERGELHAAMSGRRVAVLSGINDPVTESLKRSGVSVVVSCPFPRSVHSPKLNSIPSILEGLFQEDWDLLLCSAGGYSPIFCHYSASRGRQAFDIGSADGIIATGKRGHAQFTKISVDEVIQSP